MKITNLLMVTIFLIAILFALNYKRANPNPNNSERAIIKLASSAQEEQGTPAIEGARLKKGKKLSITGENFDQGAVLLIDGVAQKTKNNASAPTTLLVAKKAGLGLIPDQIVSLQIMNSSGVLSQEVAFYTGCGSRN